MEKEQRFDCPLCGEKDIIIRSAIRQVTEAGRDQGGRGLKRVLGNYSTALVGGGYDYSHAEACPQLVQVKEKKDLLAYYLGTNNSIRADFAKLKDYQDILKQIEVAIDNKNVSRDTVTGKQWFVHMFLTYQGKEIKEFPAAVARTVDEAFNALRHKLLCGEVISVSNKKWQVTPSITGSTPKLVEVES